MPSKNGCNKDYQVKLQNPGIANKMRMVPANFKLSGQGANSDLGGGAKKPGKGKA